MAYEIIYVCDSINNKNVREGELNVLEKHEKQLCFVFGSDEMNIKKRFYNDIETLNKDFNALVKIKNKEKVNERFEEVADGEIRSVPIFEESEKEIKKETKKTSKEDKLDKYKIIKRKK